MDRGDSERHGAPEEYRTDRSGPPGAALVVRSLSPTEAATRLDELVALVLRSKASWGYDAAFMSRFAATSVTRELVGAHRVCLVALLGERPVGLAVADDEGSRAWLEDLWVDPPSFGCGVGRALFDAILDVARSWGREVLELESDPHAEGFYLAMGARRTGTRPSSLAPDRPLPLLRYDLEVARQPPG